MSCASLIVRVMLGGLVRKSAGTDDFPGTGTGPGVAGVCATTGWNPVPDSMMAATTSSETLSDFQSIVSPVTKRRYCPSVLFMLISGYAAMASRTDGPDG